MILRILITYTALSMLAGGCIMFLDLLNDYRWNCERAVTVLWLGPLVVWGVIGVVSVLAFVWA